MEHFEKIIRLLKPRYYNRITYVLVITGCSLFTKPIWLELLNALTQLFNQSQNEYELSIIGKWDWLVGLFLIVTALYWNTRNRLIDIRETSDSEPGYKRIVQNKFSTFYDLCCSLYPIIKDNEYIFKTVGPNSNAINNDELRTDLTMWYKYRSESILPNNQKIKELIENNDQLLEKETKDLANKMILHIDAFEEHIQNPDFDYSKYRFPIEFQELIETTCFSITKESNTILKQKKWLEKRLKKLALNEWYLIGSALFVTKYSRDLDVVILLAASSQEESIKKIESLRLDFKVKFKYGLHPTIFKSDESPDFQKFITANKKIKGNG